MDNTKNKLKDLNDYLFMTLENLMDEEKCKDAESTSHEIAKAKAVCNVSSKIIDIANTQLKGLELAEEYGLKRTQLPLMIGQ